MSRSRCQHCVNKLANCSEEDKKAVEEAVAAADETTKHALEHSKFWWDQAKENSTLMVLATAHARDVSRKAEESRSNARAVQHKAIANLKAQGR